SVIGAFYYLRIIKVMYFEDAETDQKIDADFDVKTILSINALSQLGLLIVLPVLIEYCIRATQHI
ncbi:MAG: NADH:ubiquinone oxidoreductase subunit N, partial [Proteobacteria bacterium]|nr:NADH:ubiquinone oxidoreductase subunit N [Pseudomonadota bacterium]